MDMDDMCVMCGESWGDHIGTKCPNSSTKWCKVGDLLLKDVAQGARVRLYADKDGNITNNPVHNGGYIEADVSIPHPRLANHVCLVWKMGEACPPSAWHLSFGHDTKHLAPTYERGYWAHNILTVVRLLGNARISPVQSSSGMHCGNRFCNAFNPYGQPNTPTGQYICYQCRQGGITFGHK
jgi:hypothetical protein